MATPQTVICTNLNCKRNFIFLRGALESCPNCGAKYKSHRGDGTEETKTEEGCDHCRGFEGKMHNDAGLRHALRNNKVVCTDCGRVIQDMCAPTAGV